jgi:hypothetical protein
MNTSRFDETLEALKQIFSEPCPKCGKQWTFVMKGENKWSERRTCGCKEYFDLIEERRKIFLPLQSDL